MAYFNLAANPKKAGRQAVLLITTEGRTRDERSANHSQMIDRERKELSTSRSGGLIVGNGLLRRFLQKAEVDRPVMFALLARGWQVVAGPITLLLIARSFTPEEQGFYYTFASLLGLQTFVELAFHIVIINVASHEWATLSLDNIGRITGAPDALSRLISLGRLVFKWYAAASLIFVVGVGIIGSIFFLQLPEAGIEWKAPWWTLVILSGLLLWALPFNSILEGCNQVATINKFRLSQSILGSVALWATLVLGGGLWAAVVAVGVNLLRDLYLILIQYRNFFESFLKPPTGARVDWLTEILPMQWRLGLAGLVNYFAFSLFNPVMFYYHGAVVAGQMGMTWQVVSGVQMVALTWIQTSVPRFGILIALKEYVELDRLWLRKSLVSLIFLTCGAGAVLILVYVLNVFRSPLAERLLTPIPTGLFLLAAILMQISQCQSAYLRAHKREVIMVMSVTSSLLIGALVWWYGSSLGPTGAAVGYLAVVAGYIIPYETLIWFRCRALWHRS